MITEFVSATKVNIALVQKLCRLWLEYKVGDIFNPWANVIDIPDRVFKVVTGRVSKSVFVVEAEVLWDFYSFCNDVFLDKLVHLYNFGNFAVMDLDSVVNLPEASVSFVVMGVD